MTTVANRFTNSNTGLTFVVTAALIFITTVGIYRFDVMLVAGLYLALWLMFLFYHHPLLLVCLWPLVSTVDVFLPFYPLRAGTVAILPLDPVYFFTIAHLGLYALTYPKKVVTTLKENMFLSIFLALVAVSIVVYTPIYGQSAVGEARKFYFMFLFPLLASVSIKEPADLKRLLLVLVTVASLIGVVAFVGVATGGSIVRVLDSEATLIIALVAFALLLLRINRVTLINPLADKALLAVFSLLAVGSGQRSVWLAIGLGAILLVWLYRHLAVFMAKALIATAAILVVISLALIAFPQAGARLTEKFAGIVDPYSDPTARWRIAGWEKQLETLGKANPLIGDGLGGYYRWKSGSNQITFSPHNAYVQLMLKFGVIGLLIYGLLLVEVFRKMLTMRKKLQPGPMRAFVEMGILCFGAGHGYMMGYGFAPIILFFFAVGISAVKLCKNSR